MYVDEIERKFWDYVKKRGYPTDPKGLLYESKEHGLWLEIRDLYMLDRKYLEGENIGWIAGMSLSGMQRRFIELHSCLVLLMKGEKAMLEEIEENINFRYGMFSSEPWFIIGKINSWISWMDNGGIVDVDDVREYLEKSLNELRTKNVEAYRIDELILQLKDCDISEETALHIREMVESARKRREKLISHVEESVRDIENKLDIDLSYLYETSGKHLN